MINSQTGLVTIGGLEAVAAARQLLPLINEFGAGTSVVHHAVSLAAGWKNYANGFALTVARAHEFTARQQFGDPAAISYLPPPVRLALEMSLHEDEEQRALEGELAQLEQAWKDAETIAHIADGLLPSTLVERAFAQLKQRV